MFKMSKEEIVKMIRKEFPFYAEGMSDEEILREHKRIEAETNLPTEVELAMMENSDETDEYVESLREISGLY